MMTNFLYLLCFLLSWIFTRYILFQHSRRRKNMPPGPTPLPIIGNLLSLGDKPHISLARLAQTHGPVMWLQFGTLNTVIVSSPSAAKEVMRGKNDVSLSHRNIPDVLRAQGHRDFSIGWLPPHSAWRNLRKIANSLVFSTSSLDARSDLRTSKIQQLLTDVDASCRSGVAINIGQVAFNTTLNLLSNTFFSVDLADHDMGLGKDGNRVEFKEIVSELHLEGGKPNLSDYFPILKWLDPQGRRSKVDFYFGKVLNIIDSVIDKRLEKGTDHNDLGDGDTLDALLNLTRDTSGEEFNRDHLRHMILDFFLAGTDTTVNTLEWAMTELMRSPTKLKIAQEELENIIGKDNPVKEGDIAKLPYLQAIIKETLRLHPPAPLLLPRKTSVDVHLDGFLVPKDTQVMVNVWFMGRDPSIWEDSDLFLPERFLNSNIDVKGQDFELIPFGSGRRMCPGIPLASRMLPMMLTSLIHSFDWRLEDGVTPETIDMEDKFGMTVQKTTPLMVIPIKK